MNFEGSQYKTECFERFKNTLEQEYKKMFESIDGKIQENIMNCVGRDLYDYSDIDDLADGIKRELYGEYQGSECIKYKDFYQHYMDRFVPGEKIIVNVIDSDLSNSSERTLLTNYGRMMRYYIDHRSSPPVFTESYITEYNFWIPLDYIFIIKSIRGNASGREYNLFFSKLSNLIKYIKENLYNGKYVKNNVDIHHMDVYQEHLELDKQKKEFEQYKAIKEQEIKTQTYQLKIQTDQLKIQTDQLKIQQDDIATQNEKNRLVIGMIKIENIKLIKHKEEFEKHALEYIDIDDFMNGTDGNPPSYNSHNLGTIFESLLL
jgi:hypothetical protein